MPFSSLTASFGQRSYHTIPNIRLCYQQMDKVELKRTNVKVAEKIHDFQIIFKQITIARIPLKH